MTEMLIDYDTPHGRAHTRAADLAFLLTPHDGPKQGLLAVIAAMPDRDARVRRLREMVDVPGVDYDLVRRSDGTLTVEVRPEPGQSHPPVYADITRGRARSLCTCPEAAR